jgi:hypothetical protein
MTLQIEDYALIGDCKTAALDNRRHRVGKDSGKAWEISRPVAHHAKGASYRFLAAGDAVKVAHSKTRRAFCALVNCGRGFGPLKSRKRACFQNSTDISEISSYSDITRISFKRRD